VRASTDLEVCAELSRKDVISSWSTAAAPRHDSALLTFGPEVTWRNGWSLMAKFEGEFASGAQTYAGTARLRYVW
jgi:uncharacterized protein with beta-barrel porin domain